MAGANHTVQNTTSTCPNRIVSDFLGRWTGARMPVQLIGLRTGVRTTFRLIEPRVPGWSMRRHAVGEGRAGNSDPRCRRGKACWLVIFYRICQCRSKIGSRGCPNDMPCTARLALEVRLAPVSLCDLRPSPPSCRRCLATRPMPHPSSPLRRPTSGCTIKWPFIRMISPSTWHTPSRCASPWCPTASGRTWSSGVCVRHIRALSVLRGW
jgi:hypothetical protein